MFGIGKKTPSKEEKKTAISLNSGLASVILASVGLKNIPTMPAQAQKAFELSTNPKAEARDFIGIIESDEGLSARVIKIANSVYFDRGKKNETIEESVTLIGLNEIRSLLSATTLSEIFPSSHPLRKSLWEHDVATALIAKVLASRFLPGKEDAAFLGGLMHDIGKLLLIQRSGDAYAKVIAKVEKEGCDFTIAEEEFFPFTHCDVGQLIGEKWHFSPELLNIIKNHHLNSSALSLPTLIGLSDAIAHANGFHPAIFSRLRKRKEEELSEKLDALGLPHTDHKNLLERCKKAAELELGLYAGEAST